MVRRGDRDLRAAVGGFERCCVVQDDAEGF